MATELNFPLHLFSPHQGAVNRKKPARERFLATLTIAAWLATMGSIGVCIVVIAKSIPKIDSGPQTAPHINLVR
ncbi:MAG: hypothetical protein ABSF53_11290 [Terracidiphilus sp.]|jgi:hypothetical protein